MAEVENVDALSEFNIDLLTDGDFKKYYLKWTMKNFSQLPIDEEFASTPFRPIPDCELKLYVRKGHDQLFLLLENKFEKEVTTKASIIILDTKGKRWFSCNTTSYFCRNERKDILGCVKSIYPDLNKLKDDILIIICCFTIIRKFTTKCTIPENDDTPKKYDGLMKLAEDLKTLCIDKQHVDFTLKMNDGDMPANKAILSARSPVFDRMFRQNLKEQEDGTVQIDDVTFTVMKKLVDFLYTAELNAEDDYDSAAALYYAADKYEVLDLRKMCADTLMSLVTVKNVTETLVIADRHSDEEFKNRVLTFLCHNMCDVVKSHKWEEFVSSKTKLAAEVIKCYSETI